jgi:hypothetical protein
MMDRDCEHALNRLACRENLIRAVGLVIQAEYGWPGPVSGPVTDEGHEEFREQVEGILEQSCRAFVAAIEARDE